jgi:hypothetical protein
VGRAATSSVRHGRKAAEPVILAPMAPLLPNSDRGGPASEVREGPGAAVPETLSGRPEPRPLKCTGGRFPPTGTIWVIQAVRRQVLRAGPGLARDGVVDLRRHDRLGQRPRAAVRLAHIRHVVRSAGCHCCSSNPSGIQELSVYSRRPKGQPKRRSLAHPCGGTGRAAAPQWRCARRWTSRLAYEAHTGLAVLGRCAGGGDIALSTTRAGAD